MLLSFLFQVSAQVYGLALPKPPGSLVWKTHACPLHHGHSPIHKFNYRSLFIISSCAYLKYNTILWLLKSTTIFCFTGQNLAAGYNSWTGVLNAWWNEIDDFVYNRQHAMQFYKVGHFTQMAWAESARIGCAWTTCSNPELSLYGGRLYVCNYAPA